MVYSNDDQGLDADLIRCQTYKAIPQSSSIGQGTLKHPHTT